MPELTEIEKTTPPAAEAVEEAGAGSGSDSDTEVCEIFTFILQWNIHFIEIEEIWNYNHYWCWCL